MGIPEYLIYLHSLLMDCHSSSLTAPHANHALHRNAHCTALQCTVLHCTDCTALHCTALPCQVRRNLEAGKEQAHHVWLRQYRTSEGCWLPGPAASTTTWTNTTIAATIAATITATIADTAITFTRQQDLERCNRWLRGLFSCIQLRRQSGVYRD